MNDLLFWYRFHSGEYSDAEIKGLVSTLNVGQTTMLREEYDSAWVVDASLREGPGREEKGGEGEEGGNEMEVKEQVQGE